MNNFLFQAATGHVSPSNNTSNSSLGNRENGDYQSDGRGGRRGRKRGGNSGRNRGRGGPDDSDEEYDNRGPMMPRPSGPASLFDFVDSKIVEKKGKYLYEYFAHSFNYFFNNGDISVKIISIIPL